MTKYSFELKKPSRKTLNLLAELENLLENSEGYDYQGPLEYLEDISLLKYGEILYILDASSDEILEFFKGKEVVLDLSEDSESFIAMGESELQKVINRAIPNLKKEVEESEKEKEESKLEDAIGLLKRRELDIVDGMVIDRKKKKR